jgi:hypothetical protein
MEDFRGIKVKIIDFNNLNFEEEVDFNIESEIMKPINEYIAELVDKSGILILLKYLKIWLFLWMK